MELCAIRMSFAAWTPQEACLVAAVLLRRREEGGRVSRQGSQPLLDEGSRHGSKSIVVPPPAELYHTSDQAEGPLRDDISHV